MTTLTGLALADRALFERACRERSLDMLRLRQRVDPGAWAGPAGLERKLVRLRARLDVSGLRRWGRRELAAWLALLDRRSRREVGPALGMGLYAWRLPWRRLSPREVVSLQACLLMPLPGDMDIEIRAGIHRLARKLVRHRLVSLDLLLDGWDPAWSRCFRSTHARLAFGTGCVGGSALEEES
ncbi:MAG: hypothetical protein JXR96_01260 [Deltaproteobacteria bacterium]|nr:hypothetical protein [Deltaproteobacteria bacterium]